jgi:hypothetical protein
LRCLNSTRLACGTSSTSSWFSSISSTISKITLSSFLVSYGSSLKSNCFSRLYHYRSLRSHCHSRITVLIPSKPIIKYSISYLTPYNRTSPSSWLK